MVDMRHANLQMRMMMADGRGNSKNVSRIVNKKISNALPSADCPIFVQYPSSYRFFCHPSVLLSFSSNSGLLNLAFGTPELCPS
jgi:hypothetical protein